MGVIASKRYISRGGSAGRHDGDSLEGTYIRVYREDAFRRLFRMQRPSFWPLVEPLTNSGGLEYWKQKPASGPGDRPGLGARIGPSGGPLGKDSRPIYLQIAVALYMLGGGGRAVADGRIQCC